MKTALKFVKKIYKQIYTSIAFYPVVISACFLVFGLVMVTLERRPLLSSFKNTFPEFIIRDLEIAKTLLSVLIGGVVSLTVFSFTMVMVVLNQASTNFSPRLLPGLISDKRHQIILGTYIGTLIYCLMGLIVLGSRNSDGNHFGLLVMIAALFGIVCLGLFVTFIHGISSSIQIHRIVENIFTVGKQSLEEILDEVENRSDEELPDTREWHEIRMDRTGYFKGFDTALIEPSLKEKTQRIEILPHVDAHLWKGETALRIEQVITDSERDSLLFAMHISSDRHGAESYVSTLTKLMEIAVKAMSPGINDPGTAIEAVHKMGQLLRKALTIPPKTGMNHEEISLYLIKNYITADTLLQATMQPIRRYAKNDVAVLSELVKALKYIDRGCSNDPRAHEAIVSELNAIKEDIEDNISNKKDRNTLEQLLT
ncbi:DUF2254 domain-containing protein [Flavobacteriaceae bacterium TP-CH-4]|uniref:DUF2254 domain-containing protein n=1 Tax=Pelagihabitans pacificus TaxID=2696054 RepID=A0A967AV83_9FLAO|nr:DUF2254 domain-containing protein [Pelagihabitans pacificus]NHF61011.1 DUF2254 domain-containing protein [Pelagihabitans pacificus]